MIDLTAVRRWWHEGETDDSCVYAQMPSESFLWVIILVLGGIVFKFRPYLLFVLLGVYAIMSTLFSFRRAVVLNQNSVLFRPALGALVSLKLSQVDSVQKTRVVTGTTFLARGGVRGIRVKAGASSLEFPLSLRNSELLVAKLEDVVKANTLAVRGRQ